MKVRPIPGLPGYCASRCGKIYSKKSNKFLKLQNHRGGYVTVSLSIEGKESQKKVHILVAKTYLANPNHLPKVNHINGNKHDNRVENLEWITSKGNTIHAYENGLINSHVRPICQFTFGNDFVAEYESIVKASKIMAIDSKAIGNACRQKGRRSAGGFIWIYAENKNDGVPRSKHEKPIDQYTLEGEFIKRFPSMRDAAEEVNINPANISGACSSHLTNKIKTCRGYIWKYAIIEKPVNPLVDETEDWVELDEYPGYKISADGRVFSVQRKIIMKLQKNAGYHRVGLTVDGVEHKVEVHRLVALAYLPNPDNLPKVNHKDNDGYNNDMTNLEWITQKGNAQHAIDNGFNPSKRAVNQYTKSGKFVATHNSMKEAATTVGVKYDVISRVCRGAGRNKTAGGYVWTYA